MLQQDLTSQIMDQNSIPLLGRYQKGQIKKVIGLMKDELGVIR